jgi:hypothetical protein
MPAVKMKDGTIIKRCSVRNCKAVWTCRKCAAKCCEHYCNNKKDDRTALCGRCQMIVK